VSEYEGGGVLGPRRTARRGEHADRRPPPRREGADVDAAPGEARDAAYRPDILRARVVIRSTTTWRPFDVAIDATRD
jgi:hypothetical protein